MKYTRLRHLLALSSALVLVTASAVEPAAAQGPGNGDCNIWTYEFFVENNANYDVEVSWTPNNGSVTLGQNQCFRADTNGDSEINDMYEAQWQENVLYIITVKPGNGNPYKVAYRDCDDTPDNGPPAPANPCTNYYRPTGTFATGDKNDMCISVESNNEVHMGYSTCNNHYFTTHSSPTLWNLKYDFHSIPVHLGFFSCLITQGSEHDDGPTPRLTTLTEPLAATATSTALTNDYVFGASNYPNPFNPATTIGYALPEAAQVRLEVFDLLGRSVASLVDRFQEAGSYEAVFEAADLPSGTYLYRLQAGALRHTGRMVLSK